MFNVFLNHWFVLRCSDELWIFFRSNQTHFLDMFDVLFWKAYIANDDSEVEGVWEDWYTDQVYSVRVTIVWYCAILHQPVEYLPWAPDRPYDGGTKYNCMLLKVNFKSVFISSHMLQVTQKDSGTTLATMTNPNIVDEKCDRGRCSICEVAAPVRRVIIRGLCQLSIFNRSLKHLLTGSCWLCFTWLFPPGFTITSSMRTGNQCLLEATLPFSSTTEQWAPGCGTANSVSTDNLILTIPWGKYSKDDINMVSQVRSEGPKCRCHKSVTRRNPSARFLLLTQKLFQGCLFACFRGAF